MAKTTRVSVDFPSNAHIILKMYCAEKGISIKQYIIDTVLKDMKVESDEESDEVDDITFKKAKKKLMKNKNALWKSLAKK